MDRSQLDDAGQGEGREEHREGSKRAEAQARRAGNIPSGNGMESGC